MPEQNTISKTIKAKSELDEIRDAWKAAQEREVICDEIDAYFEESIPKLDVVMSCILLVEGHSKPVRTWRLLIIDVIDRLKTTIRKEITKLGKSHPKFNDHFTNALDYHRFITRLDHSVRVLKCMGKKKAIDMDIYNAFTIRQKLIYFRLLKDNWDDDGGLAPTTESLDSSRRLLGRLNKRNKEVHSVVPSRAGGVIFTLINKDNYLSVEIERAGAGIYTLLKKDKVKKKGRLYSSSENAMLKAF